MHHKSRYCFQCLFKYIRLKSPSLLVFKQFTDIIKCRLQGSFYQYQYSNSPQDVSKWSQMILIIDIHKSSSTLVWNLPCNQTQHSVSELNLAPTQAGFVQQSTNSCHCSFKYARLTKLSLPAFKWLTGRMNIYYREANLITSI